MQLKKYLKLVEGAPISNQSKNIIRTDISKAQQKCTHFNNKSLSKNQIEKREGPEQETLPDRSTHKERCTVSDEMQDPHFSSSAQIGVQTNLKSPQTTEAFNRYDDYRNKKEDLLLTVFEKHIRLCKKIINQGNFIQAEGVLETIQKALQRQFLPTSFLRWRIMKIKVTILQSQIIFHKLDLRDRSKSSSLGNRVEGQAHRKEMSFLERIPLFCRQVEKDACFPFLQKDFYSFLEVLYFVSIKCLIIELMDKSLIQEFVTKKREILSLIGRGRVCLSKQLEDLCHKLGILQDKKIFDIIRQKSEILLKFYAIELAFTLTTDIYLQSNQYERGAFKKIMKAHFCQDSIRSELESGSGFSPDELDCYLAKMKIMKLSIWKKYQKVLRMVPNSLDSGAIENAVYDAFFTDVQQIHYKNQSYPQSSLEKGGNTITQLGTKDNTTIPPLALQLRSDSAGTYLRQHQNGKYDAIKSISKYNKTSANQPRVNAEDDQRLRGTGGPWIDQEGDWITYHESKSIQLRKEAENGVNAEAVSYKISVNCHEKQSKERFFSFQHPQNRKIGEERDGNNETSGPINKDQGSEYFGMQRRNVDARPSILMKHSSKIDSVKTESHHGESQTVEFGMVDNFYDDTPSKDRSRRKILIVESLDRNPAIPSDENSNQPASIDKPQFIRNNQNFNAFLNQNQKENAFEKIWSDRVNSSGWRRSGQKHSALVNSRWETKQGRKKDSMHIFRITKSSSSTKNAKDTLHQQKLWVNMGKLPRSKSVSELKKMGHNHSHLSILKGLSGQGEQLAKGKKGGLVLLPALMKPNALR